MFCTVCGSIKNEEGLCPSCDTRETPNQESLPESVFFGDDGSGRNRGSAKKLLIILAAVLVPILILGGFLANDLNNKAQARTYVQEGCKILEASWSSEAADVAIKKYKLAAGIDSNYKTFANEARKWQTAELKALTAQVEILKIELDVILQKYWFLSAAEIYLDYTLPQVLKQSAAEAESDAGKDKIIKACAAL